MQILPSCCTPLKRVVYQTKKARSARKTVYQITFNKGKKKTVSRVLISYG